MHLDEKIRWTNLHAWEIVEALKNEYSIKMSRNVVRQLLKRHDYRLRKAQKRQSMKKNIWDWNEQFDNIVKSFPSQNEIFSGPFSTIF
ncbi:MAG TPA: hypothetical protein DEB50_05080 [Desulfobacter sp.]|nr:hypothetical protein [Desulfobacter sp.]